MFLTLRDGTVFKGKCLTSVKETVGLLSVYTGGFGYEEVITNPANSGKIILFTFPIIGASGINKQDNQSDTVCISGLICKEYSKVMSNFRAKESLLQYIDSAGKTMGEGFDTRAIMVHLREAGEQPAVLSENELTAEELTAKLDSFCMQRYTPVNSPVKVENPLLKAKVIDLGAGKSFYTMLAENSIAADENEDFDVCIVSNTSSRMTKCADLLQTIKDTAKDKPIIGFGDGAALAALACGYQIEQLVLGHHGTNIPVSIKGADGKNYIGTQNHCYIVPEQPGIIITASNLHDGTTEGFCSEDKKLMGFCYKPTSLADIIKGK